MNNNKEQQKNTSKRINNSNINGSIGYKEPKDHENDNSIISDKTNDSPLVTIGISTFNRADGFLKYALDSAVSQTWPNLEIIVSDNCSKDNTEELVSSYADPRINYIKQKKNIGAHRNFNFCLNQAKGKYFLLLHDDDMIDPDFIETCMNKIASDGDAGIIRTGTRLIDHTGKVRNNKPNLSGSSNTDFLLSWFSDKTALYLCSTLYNTKGLKEVGGFNSVTNLFNDVAPTLKLAESYGRHDIPQVKASFRRHGNNRGSMQNVENWVRDSEYILHIIRNMELDHKDFIIQRGQRFFSRKCYRYVKALPTAAQRFSAYMMIYSTFGYIHSPVSYFYSARIKHRIIPKNTTRSKPIDDLYSNSPSLPIGSSISGQGKGITINKKLKANLN